MTGVRGDRKDRGDRRYRGLGKTGWSGETGRLGETWGSRDAGKAWETGVQNCLFRKKLFTQS